jgi:RNA polymerase sigma-70 factor (ECF subfamily)
MTAKAPLPPESDDEAATRRSSTRVDPLADLGRAATAGDDGALEQLLRAIAPDILRVTRAVLGSSCPDVEDILQDCLLGLIRSLEQFRYESSVRTFALTIAFRHALAAKRRRNDLARWLDTFQRLQEPLVSRPSSPAQDLEVERRRALVAELLTTIPKLQAETLGLRAVVGLSIEDIARATRVPANTVRSRLRLAKEALRKAIEADPDLCDFLEPLR